MFKLIQIDGSALYLILVSNSNPTLPCIAAAMLLAGRSSRAMLASARSHVIKTHRCHMHDG